MTLTVESSTTPPSIVDVPRAVFVQADPTDRPVPARRVGDRWTAGGTVVTTTVHDGGALRVALRTAAHVSRIALRWTVPATDTTVVRGDAWERSYGDLGFAPPRPHRTLPWYFVEADPAQDHATGIGVEVRGAAMASWTRDPHGYTLWLDVRNGGGPARLGDRELHAATVHRVAAADVRTAHRRLTVAMLADHRRRGTTAPLVGANNWYYAYGEHFDPAAVLTDARTIVELADGHPVRPFSVIDDGWNPGGPGSGGPWDAGTPGVFDDMAALAAEIDDIGARPGIWFRPLRSRRWEPDLALPATGRDTTALDPSMPAVLDRVTEDVARLRDWGYELIKHDFSTFDATGRFGTGMGFDVTEPTIRYADPTLTTAEILRNFYDAVADAAGDGVVLGCNAVGHLAVGSVDAQRTGDDTSGRTWERTRRMGVNTLAHRLEQHDVFFTLDADCVAATPHTDWTQDRQFLDLVARSGTALFLSVDPAARTDDVDDDLARAVRVALDGPDSSRTRPHDVLSTLTPERWTFADGDGEYRWLEPFGALPGAV